VLIASDGCILAQTAMPTGCALGTAGITECIIETVRGLLAKSGTKLSDLQGIGVAFAGGITDEGIVQWTVHIGEGWAGYDLGTTLASCFPTAFHFALDVHAAALGEGSFGAARGVSCYVVVTVGTGIGAGIVVNGRVFTGGLGTAGNIGHTIVDDKNQRRCSCGNWGCLETLAGADALSREAIELVHRGGGTRLSVLCKGNPQGITPHVIYEAAQQGDEAAAAIFQEAGRYFGIALLNLVDILAPEMVVVGGGISEAGDLFLDPVREQVRKRAWPPIARQVRIVPALLGNLSGAFGAAAMVLNDIRINRRGEDSPEC
jgi:predicted NBD/HSP70 family sugar kinase